MSKFEFEVTKLTEPGWTYSLIVTASEKLAAFAKIMTMFPAPDYKYIFKGTR
jgi:hypothetical protein